MINRNSIISPQGYRYHLSIFESMDEYLNFSSNPQWVGDDEGIIFILLYNGQFYIVGADGEDTTESDNWLKDLGYPVTTLHTLEFSAVNGSVDKSVFVGEEDDTVTVTVTPDEGYTFTSWDDESTDNPRTFTVGEDDEEYVATCSA